MNVIWDWNGTLLDDVHICVEILNAMLRKRGLSPVTLDEYYGIFDFPVVDYYRRAGFDLNSEAFESVSEDYINAYSSVALYLPLRDGAKEIVRKLHSKGCRQVILSASRKEALLEALERYGLAGYFTDVFGLEDDYAYGKCELGRIAMDKLNLKPDNTVMIGDTLHDLDVACLMGIRCILVSGGHHSSEKLMSRHDMVCSSLKEVYDTVVQLEGSGCKQ